MAWQTSDCVQRGRKIMDGIDSILTGEAHVPAPR